MKYPCDHCPLAEQSPNVYLELEKLKCHVDQLDVRVAILEVTAPPPVTEELHKIECISCHHRTAEFTVCTKCYSLVCHECKATGACCEADYHRR